MDDNRFDTLAKILAASPTRRGSLSLLAGAGLGGLATLLGFPESEVGDAGKRERPKRKRKPQRKREQQRKRARQRKRKQQQEQDQGQPPPPSRGDPAPLPPVTTTTAAPTTTTTPPPPGCPDGAKLCNGSCLENSRCCTDGDCSGGAVCDAQQSCVCPSGTKLCDGTCISTTSCCTNDDCPAETTCQAGDCLGTGVTLYPELRTRRAFDLSFAQKVIEGEEVYVLRFSNTIWNAGEGRLELEGDPHPQKDGAKKIYQNLYDAPIGGTRTKRKQIASDIIYHPSHEHYHFENFASYMLLQRDANGDYQKSTKKGTKTSFCIYDYQRVQGTYAPQYTGCGFELTGLTPGWGDTYHAVLADQWIVLGAQPLGDGEYAIESTADPKGLIDEGGGEREGNNTALTYFTVSGGLITNVRTSP